jgi:hypothetical protein
MHYVDAILQMTTNWNKVFVVCFKVETGYFTAVVYSVLLSVGKSVLKVTDTLWKSSLIFAKDAWIIHVNFIVIAITFSEGKNWRYYFHYFCTARCIMSPNSWSWIFMLKCTNTILQWFTVVYHYVCYNVIVFLGDRKILLCISKSYSYKY